MLAELVFNFLGEHEFFFRLPLCFRLLVMSTLAFEAMSGYPCLDCIARNWFLRFTSGVTPADRLAASMICRLVLGISLIFPIISRQGATCLGLIQLHTLWDFKSEITMGHCLLSLENLQRWYLKAQFYSTDNCAKKVMLLDWHSVDVCKLLLWEWCDKFQRNLLWTS